MSMSARATDPSMEEILASIRRIISDDLPPRPASAGAAPISMPAPVAPSPAVVTPFEPQPAAAQVPPRAPSPARPELFDNEPDEETFDQPVAARAESLFDMPAIEAQVKAEVSASLRGTFTEVEPPAPSERPAPAPQPSYRPYERPAQEASAAPRPSPAPSSSFAPRPTFTPSPFAGTPRPGAAPLRSATPETLVSPPTNAAVSASFGTLARTIMTGNNRSLEDVVAELLRPMLRGWLDEHLPAIVERLVRAEIERVSRGGR